MDIGCPACFRRISNIGEVLAPVAVSLTLTNTIVANNPSGEDCSLSIPIISLGHNLDSDGTCNLTDPA